MDGPCGTPLATCLRVDFLPLITAPFTKIVHPFDVFPATFRIIQQTKENSDAWPTLLRPKSLRSSLEDRPNASSIVLLAGFTTHGFALHCSRALGYRIPCVEAVSSVFGTM